MCYLNGSCAVLDSGGGWLFSLLCQMQNSTGDRPVDIYLNSKRKSLLLSLSKAGLFHFRKCYSRLVNASLLLEILSF